MNSADRPARASISDGAFYVVAGLCGMAVGFVGAAFHISVDFLLLWPSWLVARIGDGPLAVAAGAVIASVAVLAAFAITRRFAPEAAGSGVQEIEGAMEGLREVRWRRVLPVKFVGGVLALSSGLVAGREGPTIHMGASIMQAAAEGLRLGRTDVRGLLAAGAAAGLAAAFNAPLAAILFVIEETRKQFPYTFRSYTAVIIASAASAFATEFVGGEAPDLEIASELMPLSLLPAFGLLGVALGALGVVFNRSLVASLDWTQVTFRKMPFVPALAVGAAVGALAILLPDAVGGGETLILRMVDERLPVTVLLVIAALRFGGTMASYATGVPGGIFAPILALSTAIGLAIGTVVEGVFDVPSTTAAAFAIAAMGGLFSSTIRAPLVGVVLVAELTGAYELILPVLVTCGLSNLVAEKLRGRPIYEVLLERTLRLAGHNVKVHSDPMSSPVGIDVQEPGGRP